MSKERQRLNLDLESLFPGKAHKIGTCTVDIRPLGILKLATITRQLKGFGKVLGEEGVSWENYSDPENLLKLATILLEQFPSVLEEASNIAIEDLQELPLELIAELLDVILDVNLESKEKLTKNFKSLAGKFSLATGSKKNKASRKRSKS